MPKSKKPNPPLGPLETIQIDAIAIAGNAQLLALASRYDPESLKEIHSLAGRISEIAKRLKEGEG